MKLVQGNAAAVFTALIFIVVIMITWYVMIKPFALVFDGFTTSSPVSNISSEGLCLNATGYWYNSVCNYVPERAAGVMSLTRYMWLLAPIILIIGLIIWMVTIALKRDQFTYMR